jgi:hypothetical protein
MGVPTSEVGYTSATTGRGDYEVHKGHVVAFKKKWKVFCYAIAPCLISCYRRARAGPFEVIAIYTAAWDYPPSLHRSLGPRKSYIQIVSQTNIFTD